MNRRELSYLLELGNFEVFKFARKAAEEYISTNTLKVPSTAPVSGRVTLAFSELARPNI